MKRIFLDANILFTAAYNPDGLAATLLRKGRSFGLEFVTSTYALEEAKLNLQLKKPEALNSLSSLLTIIKVHSLDLQESNNSLKLPLDDLPIFQGALDLHSTHLLTGDHKAFGPWMNKPKATFGLMIQTVRQFVDENILRLG